MRSLNLPNTLTVARIVLIPVFIIALEYREYGYALIIFSVASLTDLFDGLLARINDQRTQLGTILDPLADKFMLVTSFIFFAYREWIPPWLTIIVLSRDVIIVAGNMILYFVTHSLKVEPSILGKLSTVVQFSMLCVVLLFINFGVLGELKDILVWITAAVTAMSGLDYILRGLKIAGDREARR